MKYKRKITDNLLKLITYFAALISVIILGSILIFVFINGYKGLSLNFIFGKYKEENYLLKSETITVDNNFNNNKKYEHYSTKYGIAFNESTNSLKEKVIEIIFIDENSPLKTMIDYDGEKVLLKTGYFIETYIEYIDSNNQTKYIYAKDGVTNLVKELDVANNIVVLNIKYGGGGIFGSVKTTIMLVILTLLIGFPIGILTALYLNELAPKNRLFKLFRICVDLLTGIPSIIYGLIGATLIIPISNKIIGDPNMLGGNILAGALTLSVMVLPVVIKATEQSLTTIPASYKEASLALGANEIQTTFKVVLPNALPGILQAALLTVGRVIGESAALIYVIGTVINDKISVSGKGTSLAVHIWTVMAGENPNIEAATSIAIIILFIVLILNIAIKLLTNKISESLGV